ncbi:MAG: inositol monophosphatase family protein [Mycobacterium leprae]
MLDQLERALVEAVRAAGEIIHSHTGERMTVQYKTSWSDLVTEVDKAVEQAVRAQILGRFPDHGFVGEEGGGGWEQEFTWVLDPLDGTTNFAHTLPNFCTSLACYRGQEALVGAIYDPNRDELFTARAGGGAYLNGAAIQVDPAAELHDSVIGTNLMWDMREDRFNNLPGLQELGKNVRGIRSIGAAALELAYVAAGRLSGFAQYRLSPWDFGAGVLLVAEAGGKATQIDGTPLDIKHPCSVLATNGRIHQRVLSYLQRAE